MMTDPIADFLIQLKNAAAVRKASVAVPFSMLKMEVAKVLERTGYVRNIVRKGKKVKKILSCDLVYTETGPAKLSDVKRISKPSRRVYAGLRDLRPVRQGFGVAILSTPRGVLTDKEAREAKVGGEVMCQVW